MSAGISPAMAYAAFTVGGNVVMSRLCCGHHAVEAEAEAISGLKTTRRLCQVSRMLRTQGASDEGVVELTEDLSLGLGHGWDRLVELKARVN